MYEEQLKELGLTDNEVKIYLLLLKEGSMNPSEISQKLNLHRGYIYDALERMHKKEVVNSILKNNKKYFQSNNPDNLIEILKSKLENLKKIIPKLKEISNKNKESTTVELHKGEKIYRILFRDIISSMKKDEEILIIGIDEEILTSEVEPIYLEQYLHMIEKKKIKEKIIIKKDKKKLKFKSLTYKELEPELIGNTAQIIYKDNVANFILGDPNYLIITRNKEVAETYKKHFEILWKKAKLPKK
jgi:sugar-specific transcriptional regulator TrmB